MRVLAAAGAGFLLAVLWFDLMFDVLVRGHDEAVLPAEVLDRIAAYYRRVTTEATPRNRLVALFMAVTIVGLGAQVVQGGERRAMAAIALVLAAGAIGLAGARTVRLASRLGRQVDGPAEQSVLARRVYGDHRMCAVAIAAVVVLQVVPVRWRG